MDGQMDEQMDELMVEWMVSFLMDEWMENSYCWCHLVHHIPHRPRYLFYKRENDII